MTGLRARIGKWSLATYFVIFLLFVYGPMIIMAVLSFQGRYGGITFPFNVLVGIPIYYAFAVRAHLFVGG